MANASKRYVMAICIWIAFVYSIFSLNGSTITQNIFKSCDGLEVYSIRSINFSRVNVKKLEPSIIFTHSSSSTTTLVGKTVTLVAIGPVLGSMDSPQVKNELICTKDGFNLLMTVTRSASFHGAVRQNVLWQPQTEVTFVFHKSEVKVEAIWKMFLDTGSEIQNDLQFPKRHFPITVRETIR